MSGERRSASLPVFPAEKPDQGRFCGHGSKDTMQRRSGTAIRNRNQGLLALALLIPAFVIFTLLVVMPVVKAGYYSFFKWNGMGPAVNFIRLGNFAKMFSHPVFRTAVANNLKKSDRSHVVL